uniref:Uncharacterized protein n=1 Tax=Hyaloperonospora arabidopsidis (strain Emoy2) TaxID=559515 RepID=M4BX35_HYAAE
MALIFICHKKKTLRRCSVKDTRSVASTRLLLRATRVKVLPEFKSRSKIIPRYDDLTIVVERLTRRLTILKTVLLLPLSRIETFLCTYARADARRHKLNDKVEYVLGYAEDVLGCKLYFPDERTRKFVPDIRVNDHVLYREIHTTEYTPTDHDSDVDARIEEGVVDTEAADIIMEDAESIESVLTDAQDADIQDSVRTVPVRKRGASDAVHRI